MLVGHIRIVDGLIVPVAFVTQVEMETRVTLEPGPLNRIHTASHTEMKSEQLLQGRGTEAHTIARRFLLG